MMRAAVSPAPVTPQSTWMTVTVPFGCSTNPGTPGTVFAVIVVLFVVGVFCVTRSSSAGMSKSRVRDGQAAVEADDRSNKPDLEHDGDEKGDDGIAEVRVDARTRPAGDGRVRGAVVAVIGPPIEPVGRYDGMVMTGMVPGSAVRSFFARSESLPLVISWFNAALIAPTLAGALRDDPPY